MTEFVDKNVKKFLAMPKYFGKKVVKSEKKV